MDQTASSRLLTLVFTDIVDSTALKSSRGDIEAGDLMERDREYVEALAKETGGRVIDWAGDGCFLTFETSSAAVQFGLKLQETHLNNPDLPRLRIGIHMGEVTERTKPDGSVRVEGLAVDIASRVESLAQPNQVLMSEAVFNSARQRMPRGKLVWQSHGEYQLKGFVEPLGICEVGLENLSPLASPEKSEKVWPVGEKASNKTETTPVSPPTSDSGGDLRLLFRLLRRPYGALSFAAIVVLVGFFLAYLPSLQEKGIQADANWARDVAVPQIRELVAQEKFYDAYALALEAKVYLPEDTGLEDLIYQSTNDMNLVSPVDGYTLFCKPYDAPDSEWIQVASVPGEARLPLSMYRWKAEGEGLPTRQWAQAVHSRNRPASPSSNYNEIILPVVAPEKHIEGMAYVEANVFVPGITGLPLVPMPMPEFYVDNTEVTNKAYQEFVDAGGYTNPSYWTEPFKKDGRPLTFEEAMTFMLDSTGEPGPATWELGEYPDGMGDYPVEGVSWYEAMAYAEFCGKSLPTMYHWARAALSEIEAGDPMTLHLAPQSNIESNAGILPAGNKAGMATSGALDMAGNVREWCFTSIGENKVALGGKWDDPAYMINLTVSLNAWNRDAGNGFRCIKIPDGQTIPPNLMRDAQSGITFETDVPEVNSDVFEQYLNSTFGVKNKTRPFDPVEELVDDSQKSHVRYKVTIRDFDGNALPMYIDFPRDLTGPAPAIVFFPGANGLYYTAFDETEFEDVSFLPKSGRIVVKPVFTGMYERNDGRGLALLSGSEDGFTLVVDWSRELSRILDYLSTREEIDADALSYMGISLGTVMGPRIIAVDQRFKTMLLLSGGVSSSNFLDVQALTNVVTFARHINTPVLQLGGKYDYLFPLEQSQMPLFEAFAAPDDQKRFVSYDAGHVPLPRAEVIKETLAWLDRFKV